VKKKEMIYRKRRENKRGRKRREEKKRGENRSGIAVKRRGRLLRIKESLEQLERHVKFLVF
jgi:hypothetical protein